MASAKKASAKKAFAKFEVWKESKTLLILTIVTRDGLIEKLKGQISAIDAKSGFVNFQVGTTRWVSRLNIGGASYQVGSSVLEAEQEEGSIWMFEEVVTQPVKP